MMHSPKKKNMVMIAAGFNNVVLELSEDCCMEILSHLPHISVIRFKSVSKTWYSLISNPIFLLRNTTNQFDNRFCHTTHDHHNPSSILLKRYHQFANDSRILTLSPLNDYDHQKLVQKLNDFRPEHVYDDQHQVLHSDYYEKETFWVIDSCNGLLLYRSNNTMYVSPLPTRKCNLFVCNPIIHDYIKLPTFEQIQREQRFKICKYSSPNIVFDPSVSLTYKVVIWLTCINHKTICSSNLKGVEHYRFYVYSSETRTWRLNQIKNPDTFSFEILERGVLCNGVLYWSPNYPSYYNDFSLRYDVEKDVISTLNFLEMPPEYRRRIMLYFGECGGSIRLIETYYKDEDTQLGMIHAFLSIFYVMELDNNVDLWTVKYRVNIGDDQVDYFANLVGNEGYYKLGVHILDIYKTKTKKAAAGEHEIHQGDQEEKEEEEQLLLNIWNICIIPFNLSSNTFGKELRHVEKKTLVRDRYSMGLEGVVRYNTITLFPLSSS